MSGLCIAAQHPLCQFPKSKRRMRGVSTAHRSALHALAHRSALHALAHRSALHALSRRHTTPRLNSSARLPYAPSVPSKFAPSCAQI
eukprot:2929254-Rhodomonas_salina.1